MKSFLSTLFLTILFINIALPQAGSLDRSFGNNGIVNTGFESARSISVQNDGRIVAAGYGLINGHYDFVLVRYNNDGSLDTGFGTNGIVTTTIGDYDYIFSASIQSDGKIVAAGSTFNGINQDIALIRYTSNGSLDASFGNNGIVTTAIGPSDDLAYSISIQDDGRIVVAGSANNGINDDFALVRYNSNGSLDAGFGNNGIVTTSIGTDYEEAYSLSIQSDGRILAAGYTNTGNGRDFAIVRYNSNGSLDASFDNNGIVTTSIGTSNLANSLSIQSDGRILAAGHTFNGSDVDFAIARYNSNGSLDAGFGNNGIVTTSIGTYDEANSLSIQSDGRILAAGKAYISGNDPYFAIVRYNSNGTLDSGFGTNGIVTTSIGVYNENAYSVSIQNDGRIIAAGSYFTLVRYMPYDAPVVAAGNATSFYNSIVTIPVSITEATAGGSKGYEGKFSFDSDRMEFLYPDAVGTLFQDNSSSFFFNETSPGIISFASVSNTATSGDDTLFNLVFRISDPAEFELNTQAIISPFDFKAIGTNYSSFLYNYGTIFWSNSPNTSELHGDANQDYTVDLQDALLVLQHLNHAVFLTGQKIINADADLNGTISANDMTAIMFYFLTGIWPPPVPAASGALVMFGSVQQDKVILPLSVTASSNLVSGSIIINYDRDKFQFHSFGTKPGDNTIPAADAKEIEPGRIQLVFASPITLSEKTNLGEITLKINDSSISEGTIISTSYSLNDNEFMPGPEFTIGVTGIEDNVIPQKFEAAQNYPNPFNPSTTIKFGLPEASFVSVKVYDMLGQLVKTLVNEERNAGTYHVTWNGDSDAGLKVTSGAYIYRVVSGSNVQTMKMLMTK